MVRTSERAQTWSSPLPMTSIFLPRVRLGPAASPRKAFGGEGADRAAVVPGGEVAQVPGGGEVAPVGLLLAPVDEPAVGPTGEGAVLVHSVAFA